MTNATLSAGMMLTHQGSIVREEILAPLGLNVTKAAKVLECGALPCPTF